MGAAALPVGVMTDDSVEVIALMLALYLNLTAPHHASRLKPSNSFTAVLGFALLCERVTAYGTAGDGRENQLLTAPSRGPLPASPLAQQLPHSALLLRLQRC